MSAEIELQIAKAEAEITRLRLAHQENLRIIADQEATLRDLLDQINSLEKEKP